jgi:hypothetical protein
LTSARAQANSLKVASTPVSDVALEQKTGYTAHQSRKPLEPFAGITVAQAYAEHAALIARDAIT